MPKSALDQKLLNFLASSAGMDAGTANAERMDALDSPDSPFSVNKTDGSQCRRKCRRERYKLSRADGRTLFIVAAPTFASQSMNGVPLANYGEKIFTTQEQQTRQAIRAMLSE